MHTNIFLYAVSKFYSRIVLRKLSVDQLSKLRKAEDLLKLSIEKKSDIFFITNNSLVLISIHIKTLLGIRVRIETY